MTQDGLIGCIVSRDTKNLPALISLRNNDLGVIFTSPFWFESSSQFGFVILFTVPQPGHSSLCCCPRLCLPFHSPRLQPPDYGYSYPKSYSTSGQCLAQGLARGELLPIV